ncbi:alpha/beta hydrolase [Luteolibacter sp. LG18]|uniref:alpha/beta hydrolase family protein n=1 Tax=Luteolibacter sp. LG18 TaxID=2819286 RepID=UPI002B2F8915|nr:hypothetical protein llg_00720 [Luteolibacter sp. LG18]
MSLFVRSLRCLATAFVLSALPATAAEWNGYEQVNFQVEGKNAILVKPKAPAPGNPWIYRTEFFGHEPQGDIALLAKGWHVAYLQINDMYGAPPAVALMDKFHDEVVKTHHLNNRVVLEGFSRGGLYAVNYAAAHPENTAGLYLDAPVLDIRSWPGGKGTGKGDAKCWAQALAIYQLTEDTAKTFTGNPLDKAESLAKAKIPVIAVCGDADKVVPFPENTKLFEEKYKAVGGTIQVIVKPGVDHHPHSLKDPAPIVDFLVKNAVLK